MGGADELFGGEEQTQTSGADLLFGGEEAQSENRLKFVMDQAIDQTPERAARALEIQKRTGIPKKFIDENFDELDKSAKQAEFNSRDYLKTSPKVADWLLRNPDYAPLFREDVKTMGALEQTLTKASDYAGSIGRGVIGQGAGTTLSGAGELYGVAKRAVDRGLSAALPENVMESLRTPIPWWIDPEQILKRPGEELKEFGEGLAPPVERQGIGTDIASGIGQLGFQVATALVAGPTSAVTTMLTQGADIMSEKTAKDEADQATKDVATLAGAGITAITEKYGLDMILSRVPPSIKNSVLRQIADISIAGGIEAAQEFTEGLLHDVTRRLLTNADAPILENIDREMIAAGGSAAIVRGVINATLGVRVRNDYKQRAKQQEDFFTALGENATNSKIKERLPDSYKEIVNELTKDGPVENVYAPIEFFQSHFQEQGIDPRQLATELGIQRQYDEAVNTGGKIAIPTAVYAKDIAATEHNALFAKELSFGPDQMSSKETEEFLKEAEKEKEPETDEFRTSLETAMTPIRKQLKAIYPADTADRNAAVIEARLRTRAQRIGIDPQELMKRRPLSITEGGEETGNILNQIAFHGSPYQFQRFDLSKIGTGEGAQAYGHGLYFAESPGVAKSYQEALANRKYMQGDKASPLKTAWSVVGSSKERASMPTDELIPYVKSAWPKASDEELRSAIDAAKKEFSEGALYKVDISDEAIKNFLDWDKPISEQPEVVRKTLIEAAKKKHPRLSEYWKKTTGMSPEESTKVAKSMNLNVFDVIDAGGAALEAILGRGPEASQYLKSKGVPGIRYLDQGSRDKGEGTSNYVVFDDSIIKILDVNGEPVPVSEQKKIVDAMNKEGELFQSDVKKQTETPEFKKWFGDSKVVDENGEPLVVYHGTPEKFSTFQKRQSERNFGGIPIPATAQAFFFTPDKQKSVNWGNNRAVYGSTINIVESYLSLKNPADLRKGEIEWSGLLEKLRDGPLQDWSSDQWADMGLDVDRLEVTAENVLSNLLDSKRFVDALKGLGYDGAILDEGDDTEFGGVSYAVFTPEQVKSATKNKGTFNPNDPNILAQEGKDIKRGSISVSPSGDVIRLFKAKNLSTLLHELSHRWLFEMQDDASMPEASQQIKDDLSATLKYLGVESVEELDITRLEKGTEAYAKAVTANEKFAQAGESYFMEGKAPSSALRRVFATLKAWMVAIYKALKQGRLDAELTPEMRGVFDRLLATDEEIEAARIDASHVPIATTAVDAGMTDAEFSAYRKTIEDANREEQEELDAKVMAQYKKTLTDLWKEEKTTVQAEVEAELDKDPIYSAMAKMEANGIKLDREALKNLSGIAQNLPRSLTAKTGGIDPDMAAELLGFTSGEALVRSLVTVEPRSKRVARETNLRLDLKFGNMLTDGTIMEEAKKAIMGDSRAKIIEAEIKALNKKAREVRPFLKGKEKAEAEASRAGRDIYRGLVPKLADVREHAQSVIAAKLVREIKPIQYFNAARQASRTAIEAMRKKDYLLAGYHKGRELLNLELYREANKAQEAIETGNEKLQKAFVADIKQAKTRNMDMVNAARAILASHGLGRTEDSPTTYLEKMRQYDPDTYNNLRPLFEPALQNQKSYKEMTFEEYIGMRDAVLALMKTSRRSKQMEVDGKLIEREEVVANLVNRIGELSSIRGKDKQEFRSTMTDLQETKAGLTSAKAMLRRVEHWVDAMDGGNPKGAFRTYLWNPVIDQINKYRDEKRKIISKYLDIVQEVAKTIEKGAIEAPEIGFKFKGKNELLHAILHTGNESNKAKLLIGYGWGERLEDGTLVTAKWDAFEKRMQDQGVLTKTDYDFAQNVWDMMEGMKPTLQEAHHKMYGFYFSEVTANEFSNRFGTYRGGYIPAKVDPRAVPEAEQRKDAEEIVQGQNSFAFPTTGKGATMKRIDSYARPLQLDMRSIPVHIDWAMRFTYIEPAAKDAARVLLNRDFAKSMNDLDSTAINHMLIPWLQRSAQQITSTRGMNKWVDKFWTGFRGRAGLQVMALNVINTLQQYTGLTIAFTKVKPSSMRTALWTYLTNHKEMSEEINDKSLFMRNRVFTSHNEVMHTIDDLLLNPSKYEKAKDFATKHGYFLQQATQGFVDQIVWKAAYNESLSRGDTDADAVRHADSTVRETQGSFAPEDISRFEAGSPFVRAFSMFYNYFNMQANLLGTEFSNIMTNQMGLRKGAGRALYLYTFAFLIPAFIGDSILRALIAGDPDDDDDGYMDDMIGMFFESQYKAIFAAVPIAGPAANYAVNIWNKKWYDDKITTSPGISVIESAGRAPYSVYKAIVDDGNEKKAVKDTLTLIGMATGLPAGALSRPLGYLADVHQGKARPEGPLDVARGLVSGQDVNRKQ